MTFRELRAGQRFEFDHSGLAAYVANGLESGPWVKTSERCYRQESSGRLNRVGSVAVKVIVLPDAP
jgi:hypothetical protein